MQAAAVNGAGDVQKPHQQQQPVVVGAPPPPPQFAAAHFLPFHAVAPPPPRAAPVPAVTLGSPAPHQAGHEENKTVWVGDLNYWMDENYLHSCFGYTGEVSTDARALASPDLAHGRAIYSRVSHLHEKKKPKKMFLLHPPAHESFFLLFDVTNACCFLPRLMLSLNSTSQLKMAI